MRVESRVEEAKVEKGEVTGSLLMNPDAQKKESRGQDFYFLCDLYYAAERETAVISFVLISPS